MSLSIFNKLRLRHGPPRDPVSRREFLRHTAAVGAGLLISNGVALGSLSARAGAGRSVVVVGAGLAGLACAYELKSLGYDVTVVEARSRAGGRVLSFGDFVSGKNVEGGAELIGSNHPAWVAYAQKFKLEFLDVTEEYEGDYPILLDGKLISGEESSKLWEDLDAAAQSCNDDARNINEDKPWESPKAAELDKKSLAEWAAGLKCSEQGRKAMLTLLVADNGAAAEKQSYLGMLAQVKGGGVEKYWTDSEVYRCKGGNQQLALKLAGEIGKDRVVLKLAVTDINVKGDKVVVKCADGRSIEADDCVLAVPPTVWSKIRVSPPIPADLNPQMCVTLKYLASVKKRFWKDKNLAPDGLTDGAVSETWDGTDAQPGDENACLIGFSGGPAAERCRAFSADSRDAAYKVEIEKFMPGFSENFVAARFMDWPSEPWTMGGYSFPAPGQVTTIGPKLYKGLGRLHFAGEHTCYKFVGYMEGGLSSGVAVARRIAQRDGALKG